MARVGRSDATRKVLLGFESTYRIGPLARAFADRGVIPTLAFSALQVTTIADLEGFDLVAVDDAIAESAAWVSILGASDAVRVLVGSSEVGRAVDGDAVVFHLQVPPELAPAEIALRACALLSLRGAREADDVLEHGPLRLDLQRREGDWHGAPLDLTPLQFRILVALVRARGAVVSKVDLQRQVWSWAGVDDGTRLVAHIRRKIEPDPSKPAYLVTVRGEGFRLDGEPDGQQASGPLAITARDITARDT